MTRPESRIRDPLEGTIELFIWIAVKEDMARVYGEKLPQPEPIKVPVTDAFRRQAE